MKLPHFDSTVTAPRASPNPRRRWLGPGDIQHPERVDPAPVIAGAHVRVVRRSANSRHRPARRVRHPLQVVRLDVRDAVAEVIES